MPRIKGSKNLTALDKIRANRDRLEKMLLERAMGGDPVAIGECLRLLREENSRSAHRRKPPPSGDDPPEKLPVPSIETLIQQ